MAFHISKGLCPLNYSPCMDTVSFIVMHKIMYNVRLFNSALQNSKHLQIVLACTIIKSCKHIHTYTLKLTHTIHTCMHIHAHM